MNVVEHLLRQVYYVDGAVVRKHLPRKRWPTSKTGAAKRKTGKGPASPPTTSPTRPGQGAPST